VVTTLNLAEVRCGWGKPAAGGICGRPNGEGAKLQAAFTRERTSGAPLAATKEKF